jgi:hypothetical protein
MFYSLLPMLLRSRTDSITSEKKSSWSRPVKQEDSDEETICLNEIHAPQQNAAHKTGAMVNYDKVNRKDSGQPEQPPGAAMEGHCDVEEDENAQSA